MVAPLMVEHYDKSYKCAHGLVVCQVRPITSDHCCADTHASASASHRNASHSLQSRSGQEAIGKSRIALASQRRRLRALVRAELLVDASPVRIGDPATATLTSIDVPQNCREKSRHLRLRKYIASPQLPARDQIGGLFGDRNDGRV